MGTATVGRAYHACSTTEGELYINGKKYEIKNGSTMYEKLVFSSSDPTAGSSGLDWVNGDSDTIQFVYYITDDDFAREGLVYVKTSAGRRLINFEDITTTTTEWWDDPQTEIKVPSKWYTVMYSSNRAIFEASINAYERLAFAVPVSEKEKFYVYTYGLTMDLKVTFPNGETVSGNNGVGLFERRWAVKSDE